MPLYTVLAPPTPAEVAPDPLRLVFVKEGFCWPALFIAPVWLIFRRLWLILALYVAVFVGLRAAGVALGGIVPPAMSLLLGILLAFEGNGLRRWTLEGAGCRLIGLADGRRLVEAELRYFHAHPVIPAAPAAPTELAAPAWTPPGPPDVVGLFPTRGG